MPEKTILANVICLLLYLEPKRNKSLFMLYALSYFVARRLDKRLGYEYTEYSIRCPLFQVTIHWLLNKKFIHMPGKLFVRLTAAGKKYVEDNLLDTSTNLYKHVNRVLKEAYDFAEKAHTLPGWGKVTTKPIIMLIAIDKVCLACGSRNITLRGFDILAKQGWNIPTNIIGGVNTFFKLLKGLPYDASVFKEAAIRSCELWDTAD